MQSVSAGAMAVGWLLFVLPSLVLAANTLFEGGTVISFNNVTETVEVLYNTSVLVTGNTIAAIFPVAQNISLPPQTEVVTAAGKILTPGFVDTHRHLWQSAFRTIASNTSLAEYFNRYGEFTQVQKVYTPDDVYYGQLVGIYESLNAGVTSILDHAHHTWSNETAMAGLNASIDSGARVWWCYAIHNLTNGFTPEMQLAQFTQLARSGPWKNSSAATLGLAYDNVAIDPASEITKVFGAAKRLNISVITMHYLGGPWGYDNSPEAVNDYGMLNTSIPVVFSHGTSLSVTSANLLRSTNQYLAITPESEMHFGHGHPYSQLIMDQAALGVDGHFTYSADIVTQARIWLQSVRLFLYSQVLTNWAIPTHNPMSAHQAFLLATRAGGLALRRPDIGVLAVGAKADLVVFDATAPNMLGWADPIAAVMLHSNVADVQHVMVDGVFRKRDFSLVNVDGGGGYEAVKAAFLRSAARIQAIWAKTPLPTLKGSYPYELNTFYEEAVMADVIRGDGTGY